MEQKEYNRLYYLYQITEQIEDPELIFFALNQFGDYLNIDIIHGRQFAYYLKTNILNSSLRQLDRLEEKERKKDSSDYITYIVEYKQRIIKELEATCLSYINETRNRFIPITDDNNTILKYKKMIGAYYAKIAKYIPSYRNICLNSFLECLSDFEKCNDVVSKLSCVSDLGDFYSTIMMDRDSAIKLYQKYIEEFSDPNGNTGDRMHLISSLSSQLSDWTNEIILENEG
jgi:hypothetical protein